MGAWIETSLSEIQQEIVDVAPCMGAWIET